MNKMHTYLGLTVLATLLAVGCSSSSGSGSTASTPGALEPGGTGVGIGQVDTGAGTTATANFSVALDINDSRKIIGYAEVAPGDPFTAALWTVNLTGVAAVAPTALAPLVPGGFAAAFAIDEADSPVGQAEDGTTRLVAVQWKAGLGAPAILPELTPSGDYVAYAASADGLVIAGEAVDGTGIHRAVAWIADGAGVFSSAPSLLPVTVFATGGGPSLFASASGVTRIGADEVLVAGEAEDGDGTTHAALWRSIDGGVSFAALDLGAGHVAQAVNGQRLVVGESVQPASAPVSWQVSALGLADPPVALAAAGSALAVNENGRIAGSSGAPGVATVWTGTTPAPLYGTASEAFGLNNAVQPFIVGRSGSFGFVKRAN